MVRVAPATVLGVRAVVLWVVRAVAVWLVAWGVFQIGARLTFGLLAGSSLEDAWMIRSSGVGEEHGIYRGLPLVVVGVALGATSRWLARWIVRPAEEGCPRCGYASGGADGRCPECGLGGLEAAGEA